MTKNEALCIALKSLEGMYIPNFTQDDSPINNAITAIKQALSTHPSLPDAIHHTDLSEHPEYISGWNDCRQLMMEMMK
jgi:hypothetical protein